MKSDRGLERRRPHKKILATLPTLVGCKEDYEGEHAEQGNMSTRAERD